MRSFLLKISVTLCHLVSITIFTRVTYDHTLLSVFFVTIIEMSLSYYCGGLILCYDIQLRVVFHYLLETR